MVTFCFSTESNKFDVACNVECNTTVIEAYLKRVVKSETYGLLGKRILLAKGANITTQTLAVTDNKNTVVKLFLPLSFNPILGKKPIDKQCKRVMGKAITQSTPPV